MKLVFLSSAPGSPDCAEELRKVHVCAELQAEELPWRTEALRGDLVLGR